MKQQNLPISTFIILNKWDIISNTSDRNTKKHVIILSPPIDAILELASWLERCHLKMLTDGCLHKL